MILNIYSVRDSAAEAYLQPFFMASHGLAFRAMRDCMADQNHQFSKHCQDFQLFHLGTFDDLSGIIETETPTFLGNLIDLKESAKAPALEAV